MFEDMSEKTLYRLLDRVYPVGTPYFNKTDNRDPRIILGFGTWTQEKGRVLVGQDTAQTEFDVLGETGGAKTHTLAASEIPAHTHPLDGGAIKFVGSGGGQTWPFAAGTQAALTTATLANTGGGGAHNNLQPYVVYSWWVRTA